jgi:hypothetical protein
VNRDWSIANLKASRIASRQSSVHLMSAATAMPPSANSTFNLKKLNLSEALKLVELAMQKYPDFVLDVSRATSAAESRAKLESIAKFYDDIADKFWEELHREDDWSFHEKQFGGSNEYLLEDLVNEVSKSINAHSANEVFEIAFNCLVHLAGHLKEVQESVDEDVPFPPDVSCTIQEVRSAMDDMALLWIKKEGKVNDGTVERVLELARNGYYEDFDGFRQDLLETVQYDDEDEYEEYGNEEDEDAGKKRDAVCELQVEPSRQKRIRVK